MPYIFGNPKEVLDPDKYSQLADVSLFDDGSSLPSWACDYHCARRIAPRGINGYDQYLSHLGSDRLMGKEPCTGIEIPH